MEKAERVDYGMLCFQLCQLFLCWNLLHSITLDGNVVDKGVSDRVNVGTTGDLKAVHGGAGANRRYTKGMHQAKKIRL